MSKKKIPVKLVVDSKHPEKGGLFDEDGNKVPDAPSLPEYKGSDWFRLISDMDKPLIVQEETEVLQLKLADEKRKAYWQKEFLHRSFSGIHDPTAVAQLVEYWTRKRDELIKRMVEGKINSNSIKGVKLSTEIIKYDRASFIAIKKYQQHRKDLKKLYDVDEYERFWGDFDTPKIFDEFAPYFGWPILKKITGGILEHGHRDRISLKDITEILNKQFGEVIIGRCPTTAWRDISIVVLKADLIEIRYGGIVDILTPDIENKLINSSHEGTEAYNAMIHFAINNGYLHLEDVKDLTKTNISRFRKWLKEYTGKKDNPIIYSKVQGYVCQFHIQQTFYKKDSQGRLTKDTDAGLW